MKAYDFLVLVKPGLGEDIYENIDQQIQKWISKNGGEIITNQVVGNRDLSYEIGKSIKGFYLHYQFNGNNAVLEELKTRCHVNDNIIRTLIVTLDSLVQKEPPKKRKAA